MADELRGRTYLLTPDLIARLNALAAARQVNVSELVRYLLAYALDAVEGGALRIATRPIRWAIDRGRW
jgi:hypothetical protein